MFSERSDTDSFAAYETVMFLAARTPRRCGKTTKQLLCRQSSLWSRNEARGDRSGTADDEVVEGWMIYPT